MEKEIEIEGLLLQIFKLIVNAPEAVEIHAINGDQHTVLQLSVAKDDIKYVIGRKGRTADAVRTLLSAFGKKNCRRFTLEILEASSL